MAKGDSHDQPGARVLVVDDDEAFRTSVSRILSSHGYACTEASDAREAIAALGRSPFELVLTDLSMPGRSGIELTDQVMSEHPDTATLMVSGIDDPVLARTAIETGAFGYMVKPFEPNELIINVANALRRRALEIERRDRSLMLESLVRDRTSEMWNALNELQRVEQDLRLSQEEIIYRLSLAAEYRDNETALHIQRMSRYCGLLADRLGEGRDRAEVIRVASVMHDIGKIGIPDKILLKPTTLTPEERRTMQEHALIGFRILESSSSTLVETAASIARTHHERIDGAGYPDGIDGDAIPVEGRIAAIADVFDALTTDRVYRRAYPLGRAVEMMHGGRGTQFDGEMLEVFLDAMDAVLAIFQECSD